MGGYGSGRWGWGGKADAKGLVEGCRILDVNQLAPGTAGSSARGGRRSGPTWRWTPGVWSVSWGDRVEPSAVAERPGPRRPGSSARADPPPRGRGWGRARALPPSNGAAPAHVY